MTNINQLTLFGENAENLTKNINTKHTITAKAGVATVTNALQSLSPAGRQLA
jgi:hypothetical protein